MWKTNNNNNDEDNNNNNNNNDDDDDDDNNNNNPLNNENHSSHVSNTRNTLFILRDSIAKNVNGYLFTKKLRNKKLIKVRWFS